MLTPLQAKKIEYIVLKLKNAVSQTDIINWLDNFKKEEWNNALEVLSYLDYFDANSILSHYESKLVSIVNEIESSHKKIKNDCKVSTPKTIEEKSKIRHLKKQLKKGLNKTIIHSVGTYGKSGTAMMYYATHIPSYKKLKIEPIKSLTNLSIKNSYFPVHIILLDDFIGTGESVVSYINESLLFFLKKNNITQVKLYILSVIIQEEGIEHIKEQSLIQNIKFYGEVRRKAFSSKDSVFGYRPRMLVIREFCYRYGLGLYKHSSFVKKKRIETEYPLGYKNSQSLTVFAHTTPNNTLPIIWSSKNGWHPIFPRNSSERISQSKELKKQSLIWISIAEKLDLSRLFNRDVNVYSTENIKLICYIRLLKLGLDRLSIGIKLNLSEDEMNELINIGFNRNMLTKTGELASYGAQLYNEITKEIKRKVDRTFLPNDLIYLPKRFRGKV